MQSQYKPPTYHEQEFHCPHCDVYAHQIFKRTKTENIVMSGHEASQCVRCEKHALWHDGKLVYPLTSTAPLPVEMMPEDVKGDYLEARDLVSISPRAAAALLRLALQKLMVHLGEKGKNLNDDIASLVRKGLPTRIQKALDAVRVIGNNAVHPGLIDLKDDTKTATALFRLLNVIVDVMIVQPSEIDEIYGMMPESARNAIEKRDRGE